MTDLVPIRRALISLSDKTGLDRAWPRASRGTASSWSRPAAPRRSLRETGARGPRHLRPYRLSGDDGRPGEDAPPQGPWRPARRARQSRACRGDGSSTASARSTSSSSTSTRSTRPSRAGADRDEIIENIDIGGPSMVRSAAKNHAHVAIVTDPADYAELLAELDANDGATSLDFRKRLAAKAYALTAAYDSMISQWFAFADQRQRCPGHAGRHRQPAARCRCATARIRTSRRRSTCRSGRIAAGIAQAEQVQGKELSYNNLNDANAALELVAEFRDGPPTVVIVKHANPCGVASARQPARRLERRRWPATASRRSAGSSRSTARSTARPPRRSRRSSPKSWSRPMPTRPRAPSSPRRRILRLLLTGELPDPARGGQTLAVIAGGLLVQDRDNGRITRDDLEGRDQARSRPSRNSPTACSPGPSPSTSSPTPSSTPRTASPPASAPAR